MPRIALIKVIVLPVLPVCRPLNPISKYNLSCGASTLTCPK